MATEERTRGWLEDLALVGLAFIPLLWLAVLHLTSTGRDNTILLLAGMGFIVVVGGFVLVKGWWNQRPGWMSAAGCCLVTALVYVPLTCSVMLWSGYRTLTVTVVVLDVETGQPIPRADVRLHRFVEGEQAAEGRTGADGRVSLAQEFRTGGRRSPVQDTGGVSLLNPLAVQAEGYETSQAPVGKDFGLSWPLHGPPLPAVEVRLQKVN